VSDDLLVLGGEPGLDLCRSSGEAAASVRQCSACYSQCSACYSQCVAYLRRPGTTQEIQPDVFGQLLSMRTWPPDSFLLGELLARPGHRLDSVWRHDPVRLQHAEYNARPHKSPTALQPFSMSRGR
jgi:hypothetical protein